jgi:L-cysteine:1D-myo-inositol 2-amino-2-deoxy-alpha-D-glucopyranoside ligase
MSKSLGNLVFVSELRKQHDPMAIRLMIVENHYRTPWEWDDTRMPRADERLELWRGAGPTAPQGDALLDEVRALLDDDLDVPAAVGAIDDAARAGSDISAAAALLGIDLTDQP